MTVTPLRLCTVCLERGQDVPATFVASNAEGGQWFECDDHGAGDHARAFGGGFMRLHREPMEAFFKRVFDRMR